MFFCFIGIHLVRMILCRIEQIIRIQVFKLLQKQQNVSMPPQFFLFGLDFCTPLYYNVNVFSAIILTISSFLFFYCGGINYFVHLRSSIPAILLLLLLKKCNRWTNRSQCFSHVTTSLGMWAVLSSLDDRYIRSGFSCRASGEWEGALSSCPALRSVVRGEFPVPLGAPAGASAICSGHARSCCLRPLWTSQTQAHHNN